ncbi:MAG TPA: VOC family protein [Gaiellaceae bacterium]|nr:VOC family protein [Gaiellaceae bacterium]
MVLDPKESDTAGAAAVDEIPADTRLGAVHLTVADLDRSVGYYEREIGLTVREREGGRAALGTGREDLLVLVEEPGAKPADGFSGLYHFALLVPDRADLARWLAHAARDQVQLVGMSDHFVSEALYLRDPDHHGIEIYADRPRELWEGQVWQRMTSLPLDTDDLVSVLDDPSSATFDGLPGGSVMGHVHLRVSEIAPTVAFYGDTLGFGLMAQLGAHAAFLSAGGYHHHLGANTWESAGVGQARAGYASLRHATIVLSNADARDALVERAGGAVDEVASAPVIQDSSGNRLALAYAPAPPTNDPQAGGPLGR